MCAERLRDTRVDLLCRGCACLDQTFDLTSEDSTGSIASETYNYSSDEDVFTDDSSDTDDDAGDAMEKPHFYFDEEGGGDCSTIKGSTEDLIIYNSNALAAFEGDGLAAFVKNSANNNLVLTGAEIPEDKSMGSKCENGRTNLNADRTVQNNVSLGTPTFDNLNNSPQGVEAVGMSLQNMTNIVSPQQDLQPRHEMFKLLGNLTVSSEEDTSLIISNEKLAQNTNSLLSAEIHARGDRTPPIIVEMWDEVEEPRSPTLKSSESMRVPSTSRNASSLFVSGYAREEREPTPFYKETDRNSQSFTPFLLGVPLKNSGHSDNARIEREPTPFFDERTKELNITRDVIFPTQNSSLELGGHKEFHRELTPFYDKNAVLHTLNSRVDILDLSSGLNISKRDKETLQTSKDIGNNKIHFTVAPSVTAPSSSHQTALLESGGVLKTMSETSIQMKANQPDQNSKTGGIKEESKSFLEKGSYVKPNYKPSTPGKDGSNALTMNKQVGFVSLQTSRMTPANRKSDEQSGEEPGSRRENSAPSGIASERRSRSESRQYRRQTVVQEITVEAPKPRALSLPRDTSPTVAKLSHDPAGVTIQGQMFDRSKASSHSGQSAQPQQEKCTSKIETGSNKTKTTKVPQKTETSPLSRSGKQGEIVTERQSNQNMVENGSASGKATLLKIPKSTKRNHKSPNDTVEAGQSKSRRNVKSSFFQVSQNTTMSENTGPKPKTTISSRLKKTMKGLLLQTQNDKAPQTENNLDTTHPWPQTSGVTIGETQAVVGKKQTKIKATTTRSPEVTIFEENISDPKPANPNLSPNITSPVTLPTRGPPILFTPPPADTNMPKFKVIPKATVLPNQRGTGCVQQAEQPLPPANYSNQSEASGTRPKDSKMNFLSGMFSNLFKPNARNESDNGNELENSPGRTPENKRESKRRKLFAKDRSKSKSDGARASSDTLAHSASVSDAEGRTTRPTASVDLAKCSPFGKHTVEGMCFLLVMTMFCLSAQMPVEKFVCYVLASFYTFCVLRVIGLVD